MSEIISVSEKGEVLYTHDNMTMNADDWAKKLGVTSSYFKVRTQLKSEEDWFAPKSKNSQAALIEIDNVKMTAHQWSVQEGVPISTIWYRVRKGFKGRAIVAKSTIAKRAPRLKHKIKQLKEHFEPYENLSGADLELARRIDGYRKMNMSDEEIMTKIKVAS